MCSWIACRLWLTVFAAHRHRERAEPTRLDARRPRRQRRGERQARARARAAVRARGDVERRGRVDRRVARPRRERRRASCRSRSARASPAARVRPPKKCSSASSNGSCGLFFERRDDLPRRSVERALRPASFTSVPDTGSSATMYIATRLPNGFASWAARYTAPSSGFGSSGVLILTVADLRRVRAEVQARLQRVLAAPAGERCCLQAWARRVFLDAFVADQRPPSTLPARRRRRG